ncbi:MAG: hypothetical protein WCP19_06125, partial [Chloroflexota bacterium]
ILIYPLYYFSFLIIIFTPAVIIILQALGRSGTPVFTGYASRLTPAACWLFLSALELSIYIAYIKSHFHCDWNQVKLLLRSFFIIILVFSACFLVIFKTGMGTNRLNDGSWGQPAAPLLEWQIIIALISSLIFFMIEKFWKINRLTWFGFFIIYLLTCTIWLSQPINPGFFATAPRAPNFEIYPFSDALIYAQNAQSALVGNGFNWPEVPTRPLYIAILTWLHFFAGQDYLHVIFLQTLWLAFFPAILYLVGSELAGRPFGFGLALLAVFRDLTVNKAAQFSLNYTYTKLFFSELPAAFMICIFTLLILRWLKRPSPIWFPLLAGGVLGIGALFRLQSAVLLAGVIPFSFFFIKNKKMWLSGAVLMTAGVVFAITPWLIRNYIATGGLVLDNPISQSMVLARRWSGNNGNDIFPHLPGEGDAQYSSRMAGIALQNLKSDPGRIIGDAANHFVNNEIGNLFVFPLRDHLESINELGWPSRAFWQSWTGQPTSGQIPFIITYLLLLAIGLGAAYQSAGPVSILPILFSILYNIWTSLFLSSGDRFLVPIDWTVYLYMFLGLYTIFMTILIGRLPFTRIDQNFDEHKAMPAENNLKVNKGLLIYLSGISIAILMAGSFLPMTEVVFPRMYPALASNVDLSKTISLHGRLIYPRWYKAGDGEPGTAKIGYGKSDQARLVFYLVGEKNTLIIFPARKSPAFFPNASDVTVTGNFAAGYFAAESITISSNGRIAEYKK